MNIEKTIGKDFSGVIFVKIHNKIIIQKAYGYADIVNEIPNDMDGFMRNIFHLEMRILYAENENRPYTSRRYAAQ
jgi:hypothetical protein